MPPTNPEDARYTLTELADLAGVTARTVRYYISQGLLAVDVSPGPGPKYDDTHLARLRLIKRLQAEHQPLAEIRHRLEGLSDADVLALAEEPAPAPPDSALDYIRNLTAPGPSGEPRRPPPRSSLAGPSTAKPPPSRRLRRPPRHPIPPRGSSAPSGSASTSRRTSSSTSVDRSRGRRPSRSIDSSRSPATSSTKENPS